MVTIESFSTDPKYTIKILSKRTGVQPVTIRAWERRYNLLEPVRLENNYRLYSDRDIQVIRWVTHRLDEGLSISKAAQELMTLREKGGWPEAVHDVKVPEPTRKPVYPPKGYAKQLFDALTCHDEMSAKKIIDDVQSMFDLKVVLLDIFSPCLYEIGDAWYRGKIRIATEHFASAIIRGVLMKMLTAFPVYSQGQKLLVGCPPDEFHELASLMLSVLLRREGFQVEFLGANLPADDLVAYVKDATPAMIILSAGSERSARPLGQLKTMLDQMPSKPRLGYGGRYFNENPEAVDVFPGIFLGATLEDAVKNVQNLLG